MITKGKLRMSDSFIFGWNSRLYDIDKIYGSRDASFMVSAVYTNDTGIDVKIRPVSQYSSSFTEQSVVHPTDSKDEVMMDPPIGYKLTFSVAKSCTDEFEEILETLMNKNFDNHIWKTSKNKEKVKVNLNTISKSQSIHRIGKVDYVRYEWTMKSLMSEVMAACYVVESAVEIFGKCWGVTEDGEKVCLMKFPVGSMVNLEGNKSEDWLVLDWSFDLLSPSFHHDYEVVAMTEKPGSAVVSYDKRQLVSEHRISWSRNGRIDDILE